MPGDSWHPFPAHSFFTPPISILCQLLLYILIPSYCIQKQCTVWFWYLCGQHKTSYARKRQHCCFRRRWEIQNSKIHSSWFQSRFTDSRGLQDPLPGKSAGRARSPWESEIIALGIWKSRHVSHWHLLGIQPQGVGGSGLFSEVKEGCFQ